MDRDNDCVIDLDKGAAEQGVHSLTHTCTYKKPKLSGVLLLFASSVLQDTYVYKLRHNGCFMCTAPSPSIMTHCMAVCGRQTRFTLVHVYKVFSYN